MFDKMKENVVNSIADRFLKNSGLYEVIENPKDYKIEVDFGSTRNEVLTLKVRRKES